MGDIKDITKLDSFLIGLLGHVDSGKTAIAGMISEIVATAGLDAHPQSKERGITIDLGFTSLILSNNLVTLVDAPGHADLIRSVVASANIIHGAIIVIDAKEGIQIQTAEHLVILESLDIRHILIVINKIDLVDKSRIDSLKKDIIKIINSSNFEANPDIIEVSAKEKIGIDALKKGILNLVMKIKEFRSGLKDDHKGSVQHKNKATPQDNAESLIFPIDHHFKSKGMGVVVTGTTVSGKIFVGQNLKVLPFRTDVKVKSLQVYFNNVKEVGKGFRVGAAIIGPNLRGLSRGCILTDNPKLFNYGEILEVTPKFNTYFKHSIHFGAQINVTIGLQTYNARIFPFLIVPKEDFVNYPEVKEKYSGTKPQSKVKSNIKDEFESQDISESRIKLIILNINKGKVEKIKSLDQSELYKYLNMGKEDKGNKEDKEDDRSENRGFSEDAMGIGTGIKTEENTSKTENNTLKELISDRLDGPLNNYSKTPLIKAYIWLKKPIYCRLNEKILLSQLDLDPTQLRFFGTAKITHIHPKEYKPEVHYYKFKFGHIKNPSYSADSILVEGLAKSKKGAETLLNKYTYNPPGRISATFGNKGVVAVKVKTKFASEKNKPINIKNTNTQNINTLETNQIVEYRQLKILKLEKDKSYSYLFD